MKSHVLAYVKTAEELDPIFDSIKDQKVRFDSVHFVSSNQDVINILTEGAPSSDVKYTIKGLIGNDWSEEEVFDKFAKKVGENYDYLYYANKPLPTGINGTVIGVYENAVEAKASPPVFYHYNSELHGMAVLKMSHKMVGGFYPELPTWIEDEDKREEFDNMENHRLVDKIRLLQETPNDIVEWEEL